MCSHDLFTSVQQLNGAASLPSKDEVYRELKGALVRFGPGAEVSGVEFSSDDYYEMRISCGHQACVTEQLQDCLATSGKLSTKSCMTSIEGPESTCLSTYIRVKDQHAAETLKAKLASYSLQHLFPAFKVNIKDSLLEDWSTSCFSDIHLQINSIRCYWPRPSRKAMLYFDTIYEAKEAEKILRDTEIRIHGRRIDARYKAPHSQRGVRIRYLDTSATHQTTIDKLLGNVRPRAVKLEDPSYLTSFDDVTRAMMGFLNRYGPVEEWRLTEKCSSRESRAIVRFRNYDDAQAAARGLNGYRLAEIGQSRLRTTRNISVRFSRIPGSAFDVLKEEVDKLREDLYRAAQVRMEVGYEINECQRESVGIQLDGRHALTVAKAKSAVQDLLAGELAMWGDFKLWDNWFAKSEGSTFFTGLSAFHKGFVRVDVMTEQIFLYGSAHVKESMQNAIVYTLVMQKRTRIVPQDHDDSKSAVQGGCGRMVEVTAQHRAGMYVGSSTKKITISDTRENLGTSTHISYEPKPRTLEDKDSKPDCSICLTAASDPFQTTCGHTYCKSCFANQCSAATNNGTVPIRCLGDSDKCSHIFTLEEMKTYLRHEYFEQMLETSLAQYVRSHSRSLRNCPTPDCPSIYPLTTEWDKLICHSCLNIICINCQAQHHYDVSCEAYQAAIKAEEKFTQWKQENNVNECPKCDAPIEKIDGCNHIECTNCANHICWQCMTSFSTGPEVYKHMQDEHGTFMPLGEGWEEEWGEEEHAAYRRELELVRRELELAMLRAREIPGLENLLDHREHEPPIPAALPPTPPPAANPPLPFNHARMDDAFFETLLPPTPPPLDTPLAQAPPTQPRNRGLADDVINVLTWLAGLLARHRHLPQPETPEPAALITNDAPITEEESEPDYDSESEDDFETASSRSHTTASDVSGHSPSESDEDLYPETSPLSEDETSHSVSEYETSSDTSESETSETPPSLISEAETETSSDLESESESDIEMASIADSEDTESNQYRYAIRDRYGDTWYYYGQPSDGNMDLDI